MDDCHCEERSDEAIMNIDPGEPATRVQLREDNTNSGRSVLERFKRRRDEIAVNVCSGEDTDLAVAETRPDLILMEIKLDEIIDGIEAAERIRNRCHVPGVYLSEHARSKNFIALRRFFVVVFPLLSWRCLPEIMHHFSNIRLQKIKLRVVARFLPLSLST